jgi:O-antigen ligase
VIEVTAFGLAAVALALARRNRGVRLATLPAAAIAAIALVGVGQAALPGPAKLHRLAAHDLGSVLAHEPADTPIPANGDENATASLDPAVSRRAALTWSAMAALLLVAAAAGRHRRDRRLLGGALLATALFEVVFGAQYLARRATTIWGREVPNSPDRLRGTFVNPDHLATYLLMAMPVVFAWGWIAFRRARQERAPDRKVLWIAPPVLVWLTLFIGIVFTGSRAGFAAALIAAVLQGGFAAVASRKLRVSASGMLAVAVGLGLVAAAGLQQGLSRILATSPYEISWSVRITVYQRCLELWQRFFWVGSGLGTFRDAFALVAPPGLKTSFWDAHNEYLEMAVTTGVVGLVILAVAVTVVVVRLSKGLRFGNRSEDRAAALAALGVVAGVAIHSFFDFGMSMPANAVTFVVIIGAALAVPLAPGHSRRSRHARETVAEVVSLDPDADRET